MSATAADAPTLILGASGRVGAATLRALAAAGSPGPIRLLVRDPARLANIPAGCEIIEGAIEDEAALNRALRGAGAVLLVTPDGPQQVSLETRVIEQAQRLGRAHIVKISANTAGLAPPVSFGRGHAAVEARLRSSGLPYTILRPTIFFQSIPLFFSPAHRPTRLIAPTAGGRIAFVDVADVGAAAAALLSRPPARSAEHPLTGPQAYSLAEVADALGARLGHKVSHVSPPPVLARPLIALSGAGWSMAGQLAELFSAVRAGAQAVVWPDLERLTGTRPRDLEDWLDGA